MTHPRFDHGTGAALAQAKRNDDDLKDLIVYLTRGNFGALDVLMKLVMSGKDQHALDTLVKNDIRGSGVWVLYKDHCGMNMTRFEEMLKNPPENIVQLSQTR